MTNSKNFQSCIPLFPLLFPGVPFSLVIDLSFGTLLIRSEQFSHPLKNDATLNRSHHSLRRFLPRCPRIGYSSPLNSSSPRSSGNSVCPVANGPGLLAEKVIFYVIVERRRRVNQLTAGCRPLLCRCEEAAD